MRLPILFVFLAAPLFGERTIAVALGGWLRSRAVGITATTAAVIGGAILLWAFAGF